MQRAAVQIPASHGMAGRDGCLAALVSVVRAQLKADSPDIATVSIALGIVEQNLCHRDPKQQQWPSDFHVSDREPGFGCLHLDL